MKELYCYSKFVVMEYHLFLYAYFFLFSLQFSEKMAAFEDYETNMLALKKLKIHVSFQLQSLEAI